LATGHQIELYHPGVWAKDAFINALATKLNAVAYHFAIDTDAPKHLTLRWPPHIPSPGTPGEGKGGGVGSAPRSDPPRSWHGLAARVSHSERSEESRRS